LGDCLFRNGRHPDRCDYRRTRTARQGPKISMDLFRFGLCSDYRHAPLQAMWEVAIPPKTVETNEPLLSLVQYEAFMA
jgi:hypothetical protein